MSAWVVWLITAFLLAIAEMATMSFYLLLAAFGALCAALLAYLGASDVVQILTASIVTLCGWGIIYKFLSNKSQPHQSDSNMNMDIGTEVKIAEIATDGNLRVNYRGSMWNAKLANGSAEATLQKTYIISSITGSTLILSEKGQ
jgi:membrane protein implicated in regulation of membrane protease activity